MKSNSMSFVTFYIYFIASVILTGLIFALLRLVNIIIFDAKSVSEYVGTLLQLGMFLLLLGAFYYFTSIMSVEDTKTED